jgi:uncharacterized protein
MVGYAPDHAGLETIPLGDCLRLLASVPLGRVGFLSDGEVVVLPVNHAVSGQDVVFRTTRGSKLSAAESENAVTFEADHYDSRRGSGWSVLVTGRAEMVYDDAEIAALDGLGLQAGPEGADRSFWVRIRPRAVTGRRLPGRTRTAVTGSPGDQVRVVNVLSGDAAPVRATPFGDVGTVFSSPDLEVVWVSKLGEPVDEHWFSSHDPDVILVVQGQLKFEFENAGEQDRVLGVGDVLTLPAQTRCRAYSWPRHSGQPAVFVAAYPASRAG